MVLAGITRPANVTSTQPGVWVFRMNLVKLQLGTAT